MAIFDYVEHPDYRALIAFVDRKRADYYMHNDFPKDVLKQIAVRHYSNHDWLLIFPSGAEIRVMSFHVESDAYRVAGMQYQLLYFKEPIYGYGAELLKARCRTNNPKIPRTVIYEA